MNTTELRQKLQAIIDTTDALNSALSDLERNVSEVNAVALLDEARELRHRVEPIYDEALDVFIDVIREARS